MLRLASSVALVGGELEIAPRMFMKKIFLLLFFIGQMAAGHAALTWHWYSVPSDTNIQAQLEQSMNRAVAMFNAYSDYTGDIAVRYNSGVPTAQTDGYMGLIEFGASRNYRTAMHEMSHWLGTGTYGTWGNFVVNGVWTGTYGNFAIQAYDGPGSVLNCDSLHYWPYGWNYDNEAVYPERHIGIIGMLRRDMGLSDMTLGFTPATITDRTVYGLINRASGKMLDNNGSITDGTQIVQFGSNADNSQKWVLTLISGGYGAPGVFTLQSVASGKYLDSLGSTADGSPITQQAGSNSVNQRWQVVKTDSGYYKIINVGNGKCLSADGRTADGAGMVNWTVTDGSPDQEWKCLYATALTAPALVTAGDAGSGKIYVSWSASPGATSYKVKRAPVSGGPYTNIASVTTGGYTDTGLVNSNTYYYVVTAVNATDGETANSAEASATTEAESPGPANSSYETPVTSTYIYNPVGASWTFSPGTDAGSGVTANSSGFTGGNLLAPDGNQVAFLQAVPASISQTVSGLRSGAYYTVKFFASQRQNKSGGQAGETFNVAVNGVSIGSFEPPQAFIGYTEYTATFLASTASETLAFVGTDLHAGDNTVFIDNVRLYSSASPPLPAPPTGLAATAASATRINLSWAPSSGATGYNVKRATVSGGTYTTIASNVATTDYIDVSVSIGTTYYYVVSALNSTGEGSDSTEASAKPAILPANYGFEVPATSSYIYNPPSASWTFSGANGNGSGVTVNGSGFTAGNSSAPQGTQVAFLQGSCSLSQPVSGFVPGATYTVAFAASQRQNKTGGQTGQTFDVRIDGTTIGSFAPSQAVSFYQEYYASFTAGAASHTLAFVGTDLHGGDNTVFLDNVRITAPVPPVPATPTNLIATATDGEVDLRWSAANGATSYSVKRADSSGGAFSEIAGGIVTTNYTDLSVLNGFTHYYVVSAINAGVESPDSGEASAHPVSSVPPQVTAVLDASRIELTWSSDHTGWRLQSQTNNFGSGLGTNWTDVVGSTLTNLVDFPIDPANGSVFFRMISP